MSRGEKISRGAWRENTIILHLAPSSKYVNTCLVYMIERLQENKIRSFVMKWRVFTARCNTFKSIRHPMRVDGKRHKTQTDVIPGMRMYTHVMHGRSRTAGALIASFSTVRFFLAVRCGLVRLCRTVPRCTIPKEMLPTPPHRIAPNQLFVQNIKHGTQIL